MEQQQYVNGEYNYGFDENAKWEILEWDGINNDMVEAKLKNIDDGRIIKMEFDRGNWEWNEGDRLDLSYCIK